MLTSPRQRVFLPVAFLMTIFGVGLVQIAVELSRGRRPQVIDLFVRKPTDENLRAFEKDLENASWFAQKLRPEMQYVRFLAFNDAGEKALAGRRQWFFYRPGVQYLIEPWPARPGAKDDKGDPVSAIVSFRDQLAARGIRLLVVPVPGKASVYPEMLTVRATRTKRAVNAHTLAMISELRHFGVEVVNLAEVFARRRAAGSSRDVAELYLSQDTHWSPQGMRLAAEAVAQRVADLGWIEKGTVEYELKSITLRRHGDLIEMMDNLQTKRHFEPELVQCTQVIRGDTGEPYRDEVGSKILVLGDSFLRIYEHDEPGSGGFIAHLAREFRFPLASIVNEGGASTLVRQKLSRTPALLVNKRVVIWQFVERDIRFGMEGWQEVPLP